MGERDVVERLRALEYGHDEPLDGIHLEAADEIEKLRKLYKQSLVEWHSSGYEDGWNAATRANRGGEG